MEFWIFITLCIVLNDRCLKNPQEHSRLDRMFNGSLEAIKIRHISPFVMCMGRLFKHPYVHSIHIHHPLRKRS
jgi:hypothetical protein